MPFWIGYFLQKLNDFLGRVRAYSNNTNKAESRWQKIFFITGGLWFLLQFPLRLSFLLRHLTMVIISALYFFAEFRHQARWRNMILMMILTMTGHMNLRGKVCVAPFINLKIVILLNRSYMPSFLLGCRTKLAFNIKQHNRLKTVYHAFD